MTNPNPILAYAPRITDMTSSVKDEARRFGIPQKTALGQLAEVKEFFVSERYRNVIRSMKKSQSSSPFYVQPMTRASLAYAVLVDVEGTIDALNVWYDYIHENLYGKNDLRFHTANFNDSVGDGSQEYAAELDVAVIYGGVKGKNIGAMVPPVSRNTIALPLAAYVAHLAIDDSQLVDLAPVYYRWAEWGNVKLSEALGFDFATSHQGYEQVVAKWHSRVPEGTELAWELLELKMLNRIDSDEWSSTIDRVVSAGCSVNRFDKVASKDISVQVALEIVENDIDDGIFDSLRGNDGTEKHS
jgi:hypothetical protein